MHYLKAFHLLQETCKFMKVTFLFPQVAFLLAQVLAWKCEICCTIVKDFSWNTCNLRKHENFPVSLASVTEPLRLSHWQVTHESASRLQKHEISCMKHFLDFASVSRKWKTFMKVFHESARNFNEIARSGIWKIDILINGKHGRSYYLAGGGACPSFLKITTIEFSD